MLEIKKHPFKEKFTEINIRQRNYERKSFITVQFTTEFYPSIVNDQIVSGAIDLKLDLSDIHALDDLSLKKYQGDIGSLTISVNNNGIWEHQTLDQFEVTFGKREKNEIPFQIQAKDLVFDSVGTIVSLYTTSTAEKKLEKEFDLSDFYSQIIRKEIGKSMIIRFIAKEK